MWKLVLHLLTKCSNHDECQYHPDAKRETEFDGREEYYKYTSVEAVALTK